MKRFSIVSVILVLLCVVVVSAFAGWLYLEHGGLQRKLSQWVEQTSGRAFDIDGEVKIRLWPKTMVSIGEVSLADDGDGKLFQADQVSVELDLPAWWRSEAAVRHIDVINPGLVLSTDARGRANWSAIVDAVVEKFQFSERPDDRTALFYALIAAFNQPFTMSGGSFEWIDSHSGQHWLIENLEANLAVEVSGEKKELEATGAIRNLPHTTAIPASLSASLFSDARQLVISPLMLKIAGGEVEGEFAMRDLHLNPSYQLQVSVDGIDLDQLQIIAARSIPAQGQLHGNLEARTQGYSPRERMRSLAGEGGLEVSDARYYGVNFNLLLSPYPQQASGSPRETGFEKVSVGFQIDQGFISVNDLDIVSSGFRISGRGGLSLVQRRLAYQAWVHILTGKEGIDGDPSLAFPIELSGHPLNPGVSINFPAMLMARGRAAMIASQ